MSTVKKRFSGWAVFVGCLILMIFPGGMMSYTTGLFMYPICEEFGFSIMAYSISFTLSAGVNALVSAFVVGYLSKGSKRTMKAIMLVSVVIVCAGFALQSRCTQLWQFYTMAVIWNLGYNMVTFVPVTMMLSNWFVKKRELLTGIAIAFSNLGGAIFNTIISRIISTQGWRQAYIYGGMLALVSCLLAVIFLLKRSPVEYGQEPYGSGEISTNTNPEEGKTWMGVDKKTALKLPAFYLLCIAMFLTGIYGAGIANHVVTYLCTDGWDITAAGFVMTIFTLAGVAGSTGGGALLGKIGYRKGVIAGGMLGIFAMLCLILGGRIHALAYVFAVFLGCGCFIVVLLPSQSVANTFGLKDYAGIYGLSYAFYLIGCSVSAPFIAVISENFGYLSAWIVMMILIFLIVVLHLACINAGKRIREIYQD